MDRMPRKPRPDDYRDAFDRLTRARDQAIEHQRLARQFHQERRGVIEELIDAGFSQADIAREVGVSRQAIQKMMSI